MGRTIPVESVGDYRDLPNDEKINNLHVSRWPRWSFDSGCPRMLLVLVLEFESRRGDTLKILAKIKKGSTAESD